MKYFFSEDDDLQMALRLSQQSAGGAGGATPSAATPLRTEEDELQRAIQASLDGCDMGAVGGAAAVGATGTPSNTPTSEEEAINRAIALSMQSKSAEDKERSENKE